MVKEIRVWVWVPFFWCSLSAIREHNCEGKAQGRKSFKTSLRENTAYKLVKYFYFMATASKAATATKCSFANIISFSIGKLIFLISFSMSKQIELLTCQIINLSNFNLILI